jgi:hypothetical protein
MSVTVPFLYQNSTVKMVIPNTNEEMLEWVGEEFDPEHFDVKEVRFRITPFYK